MAKAKAKKSFEDVIAELEENLAVMEQGQLPLDELLRRYADGVELVRDCRQRLSAAEAAVAAAGEEQG